MKLRIDGEHECSLLEFLDANREGLDDIEIAAVTALRVGEFVLLGGGAAAWCRVERIE